jgi:hypothetical protein
MASHTRKRARAKNPWMNIRYQMSPWVPTGGVPSGRSGANTGAPWPTRGDSSAPCHARSYSEDRALLERSDLSSRSVTSPPAGVITSSAATAITPAMRRASAVNRPRRARRAAKYTPPTIRLSHRPRLTDTRIG